MVDKFCAYCGDPIRIGEHRAGRAAKHYCGRKCAHAGAKAGVSARGKNRDTYQHKKIIGPVPGPAVLAALFEHKTGQRITPQGAAQILIRAERKLREGLEAMGITAEGVFG